MCNKWCIWNSRCSYARWNGGRPVLHASRIHSGLASAMELMNYYEVLNNSFNICIFFSKMVSLLQSFLAGLAASGVLTSALRLITKATFENSKDVLCKGASKFNSPVLLIFHSMNTFMLMWLIEYYSCLICNMNQIA